MDETSVSLHPLLRRCWMKRGQRKLIAAPGSPQFVHLFGAYNWHTGMVLYQTHDRKHSECFIEFVEHLMTSVPPEQKVVRVLDNASYHRSRASLAALSLFEERLHVVWLPKYCPFLNPIERFWLHLKNLVAANHLHPDLEHLTQAIAQVIQQQNHSHFQERLMFA